MSAAPGASDGVLLIFRHVRSERRQFPDLGAENGYRIRQIRRQGTVTDGTGRGPQRDNLVHLPGWEEWPLLLGMAVPRTTLPA